MAILTPNQLAELRRAQQADTLIPQPKATINAALQAIEDYFETTARAQISSAINTATSPITLTAPQKTLLVKYWLMQKFTGGG